MKIIAIGGEPGSGKTSLVRKFINHVKAEPKYDSFKLVPYLQKDNIFVLGKYEEGELFSGTDRMSMAVQPEAVKFLAGLPENSVVLYEGDRLFNSSFLEHCLKNYDLSIIYLSTEKGVRLDRYKERGSEQDDTWLQGRETKISNIRSNLTLMMSISEYKNNNLEEQQIVLDNIIKMALD